MDLLDALAIALIVGLATSVAVRFLLVWLRKKAILDRPNERSSHDVPTPRGGGIAVVVSILTALFLLGEANAAPLVSAVVVIAAVSWVDDIRPLHPLVRLVAHIGCAVAILYWLPLDIGIILPGVPVALGLILATLGWVWFINLYNFMDGIDGITAVETVSVCLGILLLSLFVPIPADLAILAVVLAGAALGFAVWNWHPAKIFLGDVGSVPLGFMLGWMLLRLAEAGYLAAALILPAYYLADATVTLVRRGLNRERVWQAHRSHFYQRAVQAGETHSNVAIKILLLNALLSFLALAAVIGYPWPALGAAVAAVALFLRYLAPYGVVKPQG